MNIYKTNRAWIANLMNYPKLEVCEKG